MMKLKFVYNRKNRIHFYKVLTSDDMINITSNDCKVFLNDDITKLV